MEKIRARIQKSSQVPEQAKQVRKHKNKSHEQAEQTSSGRTGEQGGDQVTGKFGSEQRTNNEQRTTNKQV